MNTRPDDPQKTEDLPRSLRSGKPLKILDVLVWFVIIGSVGLYGVVLMLGAGEGGSSTASKSAPKRLNLNNVTVSQIDNSTPTSTEAENASAESLWQLDEPSVITADVADSSDGETVTRVVAVQELTEIPLRRSEETIASELAETEPAGKSHVWMPTPSAETSEPDRKARVTRSPVVLASNDSATGRARVSLPAPVDRLQPKSGRAYVSSPLPILAPEAPAGRSRVVLAVTEDRPAVATLAKVEEPAKVEEKQIKPFMLDLWDLTAVATSAKVEELAKVEEKQIKPFTLDLGHSTTVAKSATVEAPTRRSRVVLAVTEDRPTTEDSPTVATLAKVQEPAKVEEKQINPFTLDLGHWTTVSRSVKVEAPTRRSRVVLAVTEDRPTTEDSPAVATLAKVEEPAKVEEKQIKPFTLDLVDSSAETVSVTKIDPVVIEPLPLKQRVERQEEAPRLAQASQPETNPAPKKDVPPSPVPETTDNPDNDTLEYAGFKPIGELTVDISEINGEDPPDLAEREFETVEPVVLDTTWIDQKLTAPTFAFYHQPLYFEDPNAERCGETWGILQPAVSAAQFYLTIPALPYLIGALPPNEPVESLGDCAWGCKYRYRDAYLPPWSLKGVALQGAATTGLIFLIP